jgi:MTH538 TIR-like domain (DUF1863)
VAREPVFYSFHFDKDVFRVQQVRNIGVIDDNQPVSPNDWEAIRRRGDAAIESWIEENMKYRRCVIVLIGSETASRKWVKHEIKKAWESRKGLFGLYIHNLKDPRTGTCFKGSNPFDQWTVAGQSMANLVTCYDPRSYDAYGEIKASMETWVSAAITQAARR